MPSLDGRVAIVTGAASGIGRAIADQLAVAGAGVAVLDLDAQRGEQAAREISRVGVRSRSYDVDVSNPGAVDAAFGHVYNDFGGLDIVVNSAGVSHVGPRIHEVTDEIWQDSIDVMQSGVFLLHEGCHQVFPATDVRLDRQHLFHPGIFLQPGPDRLLRREGGSHHDDANGGRRVGARSGVRANAIAPGVQRTPMWDADVALGVVDEERVLRVTPAGRLGEPAEIGRLAVFPCSDDAQFINGACVTIDGALTCVPIDEKA